LIQNGTWRFKERCLEVYEIFSFEMFAKASGEEGRKKSRDNYGCPSLRAYRPYYYNLLKAEKLKRKRRKSFRVRWKLVKTSDSDSVLRGDISTRPCSNKINSFS
jgi:hypothetical protein